MFLKNSTFIYLSAVTAELPDPSPEAISVGGSSDHKERSTRWNDGHLCWPKDQVVNYTFKGNDMASGTLSPEAKGPSATFPIT